MYCNLVIEITWKRQFISHNNNHKLLIMDFFKK